MKLRRLLFSRHIFSHLGSFRLMAALGILAITGSFVALKFLRPAAPPNVIVVLLDTLRADHLGYNGYERATSPNLDRFAAENMVYRNAVSTSAWTPPAVASIFTGVYSSIHRHMPMKGNEPREKRVAPVHEDFQTIAEVFRAAGYATGAVVANPLVSRPWGFAQGFEKFVQLGRVPGKNVSGQALRLLQRFKQSGEPFFLYLHYLDPHDPYEPQDRFNVFKGPLTSRSYPPKQVELMARYDGEIRYLDYKLGQLFDWLKAEELYDNTIILLVADHGEQFMERGYQGHVDRLHAEETHVPLLLKAPGLRGIEETPVSIVDIYPTLLDLAGLTSSQPVHGVSLVSNLEKRKQQGVLTEIVRHYNHKAYVSPDRKKLISEYPLADPLIRTEPGGAERELVFDMAADPFEQSPLEDSALLERLRSEYEKLYHDSLAILGEFDTSEVPVDDKTLEDLKTLGYF